MPVRAEPSAYFLKYSLSLTGKREQQVRSIYIDACRRVKMQYKSAMKILKILQFAAVVLLCGMLIRAMKLLCQYITGAGVFS